LSCDFRIASDQARLGDTALKFALLCDEGGAYLFRASWDWIARSK